MEVYTIIIICFVVFIVFSLCGYCCKKSRAGVVTGPPITVTTAHITATPVVQPPYPTEVHHPIAHPMPQPMHQPGLGFGDYPGGYQTTPYPPVPAPVMYYTPHPGQNITPYPPPQVAPPPSYNEAVSQPVVQPPPVSEHYAKQSPYNPNY